MKVICVDNKYCERSLAIGKTYEVIDVFVINDYCYKYLIINDTTYRSWYYKERFKTLSEIRNDKIDKLLR